MAFHSFQCTDLAFLLLNLFLNMLLVLMLLYMRFFFNLVFNGALLVYRNTNDL